MRYAALVVAALLPIVALDAQTKEFRFVSDLKIDVSAENVRRGGGMLSVGPRGQMVFLPEFYRSAFMAFDSTGRSLGWNLRVGRGDGQEIGWVRRVGWTADSMWVHDHGYQQVVMVDPAGKPTRSIDAPSWIRPRWSDRRKYPLFAGMSWEAILGDGTMIVLPERPRNIFDTPLYERAYAHLLRTELDGRILNTVARFPDMNGNLELRDGAERKRQRVEYYARTHWRVGNSGERIAVVMPSRSDSGRIHVTVTTPRGDTVYSRFYRVKAKRIPAARRDSILGRITGFGRHSAQAVRDTVDKLMPWFESPVVNLTVGIDGSVWIWLREPGGPINEWRVLILDPAGDIVGMATLPRSYRAAEVSRDHVWAITRDGNKAFLERFRREPVKAAQPSRIARTSGSSRP